MPPSPIPDSTAQEPVSDHDLVIRLWAGQTDALATLYDRYSSLVYTLALKILANPAEAEDLTQEVFVSFWQRQAYDPNRGSLSSFLATYTRSRALDRLRVQGGRARILKRFQRISRSSSPTVTPLEQAAQQDQQHRVRQALDQLSPSERQVLEIAYFEGLSQTQIADRLGIPLGTVKTRCRQGLRRLRAILGTPNS